MTKKLDDVIEAGKRATPRPWKVNQLYEIGDSARYVETPDRTICQTPGDTHDVEYITIAANVAAPLAERLRRIRDVLPMVQLSQAVKHCNLHGTDTVTITMEVAEARELLHELEG